MILRYCLFIDLVRLFIFEENRSKRDDLIECKVSSIGAYSVDGIGGSLSLKILDINTKMRRDYGASYAMCNLSIQTISHILI